MTVAKQQLTFEEYLSYDDGTNNRYELIAGELVALPSESELNDFIAQYLLFEFASSGLVPLRLIRTHTCEIQVPVLQTKDAANRYPDLVMLDPVHLGLMQQRLTIRLEMPPPRLVVEVISPGKANQARDRDRKRAQYAARGIPEFWLINPKQQVVTVLKLEADQYREVGRFQGSAAIASPTFLQLQLTPAQIFADQT